MQCPLYVLASEIIFLIFKTSSHHYVRHEQTKSVQRENANKKTVLLCKIGTGQHHKESSIHERINARPHFFSVLTYAMSGISLIFQFHHDIRDSPEIDNATVMESVSFKFGNDNWPLHIWPHELRRISRLGWPWQHPIGPASLQPEANQNCLAAPVDFSSAQRWCSTTAILWALQVMWHPQSTLQCVPLPVPKHNEVPPFSLLAKPEDVELSALNAAGLCNRSLHSQLLSLIGSAALP